jgi:uncharacterized membrane protein
MKRLRFSLRRIFITGLLVTLPCVVAAYVLWIAFTYFDGILDPLLMRYLHLHVPGLGLLVLATLVLLVGLFTSNFLGARLVGLLLTPLERIPLFSTVYRAVRDISQVFLGHQASAFRRVALLEWPRPGIYALVFVMAESSGAAEVSVGRSLVTVFLPHTPNPTSGFVLLVPPEAVIPVDMTVEQALKVVLSAGAVHAMRPDRAAFSNAVRSVDAAEPLHPAV